MTGVDDGLGARNISSGSHQHLATLDREFPGRASPCARAVGVGFRGRQVVREGTAERARTQKGKGRGGISMGRGERPGWWGGRGGEVGEAGKRAGVRGGESNGGKRELARVGCGGHVGEKARREEDVVMLWWWWWGREGGRGGKRNAAAKSGRAGQAKHGERGRVQGPVVLLPAVQSTHSTAKSIAAVRETVSEWNVLPGAQNVGTCFMRFSSALRWSSSAGTG